MIALHHNTANAIAGRYPHASALVLGNTADRVVAQSVVFRDVVKLVRFRIQHVDALARTYPY